ncbi:MAG: serine/threonine-protein kinase [Planctomycetota bacterium]
MSDLSDAALSHLRRLPDEPAFASDRYRVRQEIGRGGMGVVYLAEDLELGRDVAIKIVNDAARSGAIADRLRAEARILARLEHAGIVPVYDAGTLADGRAFYAMKYVAGERLDEFARRTHTTDEKLRVFARICEAVAAAHAQGVVHRDLKPENVRVGTFGEVLVLDFGVAKSLHGDDVHAGAPAPHAAAPATQHGTVIGTPGYMPPEQARGDVAAIDERADVFALGAILAFLLLGSPERPDPARSLPRALRAIIGKAMSAVRDDRYRNARELLDEVHRYASKLPVSAYREGFGPRIVRFAGRYQTAIVLVLTYLVLRVAFLLFWSSKGTAP